MPEGDSVFQAAQRLHAALAGQVLEVADLRWPSLATADLVGDTTIEVVAIGKHILQRLDSGRTLHSHLKMEGRWRVRPRESGQRWGDPAVRAVLATGLHVAVGTRLGMLDLVATRDEHALVGHLGPDVLGSAWDAERAVANLVSQPEEAIAAALLDQRNLAGLATVYVAETLFLQRLSPWTPVGEISPERLAGTVARAHTLLSANKDTYARTITGSRVDGQQDYVHGRSGPAVPPLRHDDRGRPARGRRPRHLLLPLLPGRTVPSTPRAAPARLDPTRGGDSPYVQTGPLTIRDPGRWGKGIRSLLRGRTSGRAGRRESRRSTGPTRRSRRPPRRSRSRCCR
jgi:endonuclease-8